MGEIVVTKTSSVTKLILSLGSAWRNVVRVLQGPSASKVSSISFPLSHIYYEKLFWQNNIEIAHFLVHFRISCFCSQCKVTLFKYMPFICVTNSSRHMFRRR